MKRFTDEKVLPGFTTACRLAFCPTNISPVLLYATTLGVVRPPSAPGMTVAFPASRAATAEFVVPRSIPTTFSPASRLILAAKPTIELRAFRARARRLQSAAANGSPVAAAVNRGDLLDPGLLALLALLRVGLEPIGSEGLESNEDPGLASVQ